MQQPINRLCTTVECPDVCENHSHDWECEDRRTIWIGMGHLYIEIPYDSPRF